MNLFSIKHLTLLVCCTMVASSMGAMRIIESYKTYSAPLIDAVSRNNLEKVKEICTQDKNAVNEHETVVILSTERPMKNTTTIREKAIHTATWLGYTKILMFLVENGANIDEPTEPTKNTSLHCACITGDFEIVKYLIDKGANINAKRRDNETPLFWAAREKHLDIVEYLILKGADITIQNYLNEYPLDLLNEKDRNRMLKHLCVVKVVEKQLHQK